jgi:hypothetical protein
VELRHKPPASSREVIDLVLKGEVLDANSISNGSIGFDLTLTVLYYEEVPMKIQKAVSISLLLFALLLGLAACGGSSSTSSSTDDSLPSTDTAIPTIPPDIIVVLKDTKIISTMTTFKPGLPYRIVLSNQGNKDHQFAVLSTSLNVAQMTATQLQKAALAYVRDVAPGKSAIIDFTFPVTAVGVSYEMASYPKSSSQGGVILPIAVKQ